MRIQADGLTVRQLVKVLELADPDSVVVVQVEGEHSDIGVVEIEGGRVLLSDPEEDE